MCWRVLGVRPSDAFADHTDVWKLIQPAGLVKKGSHAVTECKGRCADGNTATHISGWHGAHIRRESKHRSDWHMCAGSATQQEAFEVVRRSVCLDACERNALLRLQGQSQRK